MERNRSEEDDERLLKAEALEVARHEEHDHADDCRQLVHDGHECRDRNAEHEIGNRQGWTGRRLRQDDHQQQPFLAERLVIVARHLHERHQARPQAFETRTVLGQSQRRVHSHLRLAALLRRPRPIRA